MGQEAGRWSIMSDKELADMYKKKYPIMAELKPGPMDRNRPITDEDYGMLGKQLDRFYEYLEYVENK
jgi:hypothetical protein